MPRGMVVGGWVRNTSNIGVVRRDLVVVRRIGEREILGDECSRSESCQNSSP